MWYIVLRLKTKVAKIKINGITVFTLILKDRKSSGTVLDAWLKCVMFYIITFLGHLSQVSYYPLSCIVRLQFDIINFLKTTWPSVIIFGMKHP